MGKVTLASVRAHLMDGHIYGITTTDDSTGDSKTINRVKLLQTGNFSSASDFKAYKRKVLAFAVSLQGYSPEKTDVPEFTKSAVASRLQGIFDLLQASDDISGNGTPIWAMNSGARFILNHAGRFIAGKVTIASENKVRELVEHVLHCRLLKKEIAEWEISATMEKAHAKMQVDVKKELDALKVKAEKVEIEKSEDKIPEGLTADEWALHFDKNGRKLGAAIVEKRLKKYRDEQAKKSVA